MDSSKRRKIEELALKYMNKRAYQKAIKEYSTLLNIMPEEPKYLKQISECYKANNELPKALEYYGRLAAVYKKRSLYKQAVAIFKLMIDLGEDRESIYDEWAFCYQALNMSVDAARVYRKLLESYMVKKLYKSAISVSEKILAINPDDTIAIVNYAEAELALKNNEVAITNFKKAAEIYKAQNNLAMYMKILGRIDHVTNHGDPKVLNELAMIYITQKNYGPNLLEYLLKSYRISKERKDYQSLIETTKLLVTFFKETNQRRQMLSIMYELAKIYETTSDDKKALETYNKILQIAPGSHEVRKKAQILQNKFEQPNQPVDVSKAAEKKSNQIKSPKSDKNRKAEFKNALREIDTYIKFKLFDKAEPIAKKYYNLYPEHQGVAKKLKDIYIKKGNHNAAIEILFKMFERSFKQNKDEAKNYIEEILYFDPDNQKASKLLDKFYALSKPKTTERVKESIEVTKSNSDIIETDEIESINFDEDDFDDGLKDDLEDKIDQIRFYINQGLFDEAKKDLDLLLKKDSNNPELLKLLSVLEQAVKPIIIDDNSFGKEKKGKDFQEDIHNVFEKFKEGVDQNISKDDIKTRYDLAIAYKEMGLLDDAINEFKHVFKYTEKKVDCLMMIALCYVDKGDYDIAIKYLKKSMELSSISVGEKLAIYYEIANVYELQGNLKHAFEIFKKVAQKDKKFRDVYGRLKKLVEKIKNPQKYKNNVSYV